ncbi:unnamed protein product, partial [Polarella glacialis]
MPSIGLPGLALGPRALLGQLVSLRPGRREEEVCDVLGPVLLSWKADPKLPTVLLSGLARERRGDLVEDVIHCMQSKRVELDVFHCNAAVSAFHKCKCWWRALGLLEQMPQMRVVPDAISYSSAISACASSGGPTNWELALQLLSKISEIRAVPDAISYSASMTACEKGGQWQQALGVLNKMPEMRLYPNEFSFSAAMSACEKCGQWQQAVGLLTQMSLSRLAPNQISYGAAKSSCEKGRQWQLAVDLLAAMPKAKVRPDRINYNAAISACSKSGQWRLSLGLLSTMLQTRVVPDAISYSAAVLACEKGRQWQLSLELLDKDPLEQHEDLGPAGLSMLAWKLTRQPEGATSAQQQAARSLARAARAKVEEFDPQELAGLIRNLASVGVADEVLLEAAAGWMWRGSLPAAVLANLAWAVATLGVHKPAFLELLQ